MYPMLFFFLDADYMKFVESLNNKDDADGPMTLEQVLEEIETKARINQGNDCRYIK